MVRFIILLVAVQAVFAASGGYAFQAKKYLAQGRYQAAYGQYELALKEARKEANLGAEGRILTSMATLVTHAMEYEEAKRILEQVKTQYLDDKGREDFYRAYIEFYNMQGEYGKAFEIAGRNPFKKASAVFLGEAAVAAAGSKNNSSADSLIKKIDKCDSPGQLAFYKARVADLKGERAVELYEKALKLSVEKKQYFASGLILMRLWEITKDNDYAQRSAAVFSGIGLLKPYQKVNAVTTVNAVNAVNEADEVKEVSEADE